MKILAFGIARELLGSGAVDMTVDGPLTVAELKVQLTKQYPALAQLSSFMMAVDGEYKDGDTIINVDAEVAVIPPVSGG